MKSNLPVRRLIPKWRPTAITLETPDAVPISVAPGMPLLAQPDEFDKALRHWEATKTAGALGDLLAFGVFRDMAERVASIGYGALQSGADVTPVQRLLIRDLIDQPGLMPLSSDEDIPAEGKLHPFQARIRAVRSLLHTAPDNALALLDYAQLQAAIGRTDRAEKAIRTAMALRPDNRLVLRTAARFYVHAGKADVGHTLIRRHPRTRGDPWLMASEIALADAVGTPSQFLSKGIRFLLDHKEFPHGQITELAGAISMAELAAGNVKRAREAQRKALLAPNDNVIAQAIEVRNQLGLKLDGVAVQRAIAASSEARVLQAWAETSPDDVITYSRDWHAVEPFSSRPIQMLSTVCSYKGEYKEALHWIRAGLLADPLDSGLLINLAYVHALQKDYSGAADAIRGLRSLGLTQVEPFALATEGLIAYQKGEFTHGDFCYNTAVALFEKGRMHQVAAYCRLHQALAALDSEHTDSAQIIAQANKALRAHMSIDSAMLLKVRTEPRIDAPISTTIDNSRLVSQWVFDAATNTLIERPGITARGAKGLLFGESPKKL